MLRLSNNLFHLFGLELRFHESGKMKCDTLVGMNGPLAHSAFLDVSQRKTLYRVSFDARKLHDRLVLFHQRAQNNRLRTGQLDAATVMNLIRQLMGLDFQLDQMWFHELLLDV